MHCVGALCPTPDAVAAVSGPLLVMQAIDVGDVVLQRPPRCRQLKHRALQVSKIDAAMVTRATVLLLHSCCHECSVLMSAVLADEISIILC